MSKTYSAFLAGLVGGLTAPMSRWPRYATQARLADAVTPRVPVDTPLGPITLYTPGKDALYFARHAFLREPETVEWIDGFQAGEVFWDIGASVGPYAVYAGKRGISTVAFEPNPFSFHCLARNVVENGVGEAVQAHCLGLSDRDGRGRFYMPSFEAGTSGSSLYDSGLSRLGFAKAEIAVDAFALAADSLIERYGFTPPQHIKIDVDSIEPQILKGAMGLLKSGQVKSLLIEIAPDDAEIPALLTEAGFAEARRGIQRADTDVNVIFTRAS
ncbi:FkbM family methyltransferase [bacterium SCSIO 12827]|nr:FkbM family methyltransferase [bacterium SCSIO 12827]